MNDDTTEASPAAPDATAGASDESNEAIRERIEARFEEGWPAYLAVPDAWLPRLGELDTQLAALDPDYKIAQVKEKWYSLRYYLERPLQPACCPAWDAAHPLPEDADSDAEDAWGEAYNEHCASAEHIAAAAAHEKVDADMEALIHQAEVDLIELDKVNGATARRRANRVGAQAG